MGQGIFTSIASTCVKKPFCKLQRLPTESVPVVASKEISADRIKQLNDCARQDGKYTLYWMQQSQRAVLNHALEFSIQRANDNGDRLLVAFAITDKYPDANLRHFRFMLEGLQQVEKALKARKIKFVVRLGNPAEVINELASDASEIVCDRGYLRHQFSWRHDVATHSPCRVWQVESDAIVPVETASDKREYAARHDSFTAEQHRGGLFSRFGDNADQQRFNSPACRRNRHFRRGSSSGSNVDRSVHRAGQRVRRWQFAGKAETRSSSWQIDFRVMPIGLIF